MLPLQPGVAALAARTRLPVIPVVTDSGRCWGRRAFQKRPGTIHIRVLEPIPAGIRATNSCGAWSVRCAEHRCGELCGLSSRPARTWSQYGVTAIGYRFGFCRKSPATEARPWG